MSMLRRIVPSVLFAVTIYMLVCSYSVLNAQETLEDRNMDIMIVGVEAGAIPYCCDIVVGSGNAVHIFIMCEYPEDRDKSRKRWDTCAGRSCRLDTFSGAVQEGFVQRARTVLKKENFVCELYAVPFGVRSHRKYYVLTIEPHVPAVGEPRPHWLYPVWPSYVNVHLIEFDSNLTVKSRKKRDFFRNSRVRGTELRILRKPSNKIVLYGSTWDNLLWISREGENAQQILEKVDKRKLYPSWRRFNKTEWGAMPVIVEVTSGSFIVFFKDAKQGVRGTERCPWVSTIGKIRVGTPEGLEMEGALHIQDARDLPFSNKVSSFDVALWRDRIVLVGSFGSGEDARLWWSVSQDEGKSWSDLQLLTGREIMESRPRVAWVNGICFVCFLTKESEGGQVIGVCRVPLNYEKQTTSESKEPLEQRPEKRQEGVKDIEPTLKSEEGSSTDWYIPLLIVVGAVGLGLVIYLLIRRHKQDL